MNPVEQKSEVTLSGDFTCIKLTVEPQRAFRRQPAFWRMLRYWLAWTAAMAANEWTHVVTGHITYPLWWNVYYSYVSDWILFWIFYQCHKTFRFYKLSAIPE